MFGDSVAISSVTQKDALLMALYLHLGPFSKRVISEIDRRIAELDERQPVRPPEEPASLAALPQQRSSEK